MVYFTFQKSRINSDIHIIKDIKVRLLFFSIDELNKIIKAYKNPLPINFNKNIVYKIS